MELIKGGQYPLSSPTIKKKYVRIGIFHNILSVVEFGYNISRKIMDVTHL